MGQLATIAPCYVIKAGELTALNYLAHSHPRPRAAEWINRGTDQKLRRTTIDLLLRTFFQEPVSPSIARIRETSGLRLIFRSEKERSQFGAAFAAACEFAARNDQSRVIALFDNRQSAEAAIAELKLAGVPEAAVSLMLRAGQFMETGNQWPEGHSMLSVAKAVAGGGVASALLSVGVLAIPGLRTLAFAGAVAAASGSVGATGAAIAKMLTDFDVDDVGAKFFEDKVRRGKLFVSVDLDKAAGQRDLARAILQRCGGHVDNRIGEIRPAPVAPANQPDLQLSAAPALA